jgi:hypothetical protein
MTKIRQLFCATLIPFAAVCNLPAVDAAITFTPSHIYSTYSIDMCCGAEGYNSVVEYDASGTKLESLLVPSLASGDEFHGITFGSDGLLYAVKVNHGYVGFAVVVLTNSGAVRASYANNAVYLDNVSSGKIAVDQQYI